MKVYLDVCCLNRLFDDQRQPRVSLETAAVEQLLQLIDSERLTEFSSEMAQVEVERMPDPAAAQGDGTAAGGPRRWTRPT